MSEDLGEVVEESLKEQCEGMLAKLAASERRDSVIRLWREYGVDIESYIRFQYLKENNPLPQTILDAHPNDVIKIKLKGLSYLARFSDIAHMGDGETEEWFLKELTPGENELFVDVGANLGQYSVPMGKRTKVLAFEPDERNFELLQRNIRLNGVENNVKAVPVALADRNGKIRLFLGRTADLSTVMDPISLGWIPEGIREVDCITLDSALTRYGLRKIDWLKIDVEGSEFLVLTGARESIMTRKISNILIEIHAQICENRSADDIYALLAPYYDLTVLWRDQKNPKYHYLKATLKANKHDIGSAGLKPQKSDLTSFLAVSSNVSLKECTTGPGRLKEHY
jgi:FkbM family methyltransferase